MRNIKITIEYDGTGYYGWQMQRETPTVQQVLQETIAMVLNRPVTLHGSGRTDSGVHALGQVANFRTDNSMEIEALRTAVNRLIPPDIVIRDIAEVDYSFHSRVNAQSRTYWYLIWNCPQRSAFFKRYAWHIPSPLDMPAMETAAHYLIGVKDFAAFQGADRENGHAMREVISVHFKKTRSHLILFSITGNAFVKHMVRNIIGTLVDVGKNKISPDDFNKVLQQKDRTLAGMTAPPQGLFLKKVKY
jgi:tRNA pseudouridine38-40 synthase